MPGLRLTEKIKGWATSPAKRMLHEPMTVLPWPRMEGMHYLLDSSCLYAYTAQSYTSITMSRK